MSRIASSAVGARPPRRFVLIGHPDSRRIEEFQAALARLGQPPAALVAYAELLAGQVHLAAVVRPGDIVRLESPGRDWGVERALLLAGVEAADEEGGGKDGAGQSFARLSRRELESMNFERGRLLASRQWYLGWRATLRTIQQQLGESAPHQVTGRPMDIAEMFDKPRCHGTLQQAGVAVPRALGVPRSYAELVHMMKASGCRRVFVKLAHGSSGAGMVAYRTDGRGRHDAYTTAEAVRRDGQVVLYNTRRIHKLRSETEVAEVIDALCRHRVHVEEWLPKARLNGGSFDLRVLVVAGEPGHTVARVSRSPMTNLHLLNARGDVAALRGLVAPAIWDGAMQSCREAVALYPGTHMCGADVMLTSGLRRHAILELNAFGDLLPGVLHRGETAYELQARTLLERVA